MTSKELARHKHRMALIFEKADADGDGSLTWQEFSNICHSEQVTAWLQAMNLTADDIEKMWKLMDDGDGALTGEEFVQGIQRLKGGARNLDLISFYNDFNDFKAEF